MELLMIVLNRQEYFEKVLTLLVDAGVSGATVVDSQGLGQILAYDIPIFAGLRQFIGERRSASRTIFAVLENGQLLSKINRFLHQEGIDFTQAGVGIMVTLPVNEFIRPDKEIING